MKPTIGLGEKMHALDPAMARKRRHCSDLIEYGQVRGFFLVVVGGVKQKSRLRSCITELHSFANCP